jgi:hypothetical protein
MLHRGYTRAGRGSSVVIADADRWGHTPEASVQQRIRHLYGRRRPTPLPSSTAKSRPPQGESTARQDQASRAALLSSGLLDS